MTLSGEQLRILRHMLGVDDPRRRSIEPYRNYYCANPGDLALLELERLGAVRQYADHSGYHWYTTTEQGKDAALQSAMQRRKPKAARVYEVFLDSKDCYPDLTFKEFLMNPCFAEARQRA